MMWISSLPGLSVCPRPQSLALVHGIIMVRLCGVVLLGAFAGCNAFISPGLPSLDQAAIGVRSRGVVMKAGGEEPSVWDRLQYGVRKAGATAFMGMLTVIGPSLAPAPVHADVDLRAQLEALNKQDKLLKMAKMEKLPPFPIVKDGVRLDAKEVKNAVERIRVLEAYLTEVEEDIFKKEWKYLPGFLGVFQEQEDAFIKLIEGLYPTDSVADRSSRDALSYEAQRMFIELDNLREAAKFKRARSAERAYAGIALAYDRFLKAGDLYKAYDPITSTEPFYANIPTQEAIKYDNNGAPKVTDQIVVLGGPDKGKTGKLIGLDDTKGVIKLDTNGKFSEVKMISIDLVGKRLAEL